MIIEIDEQSGFCNGVVRAIQKAEQELANNKSLYCLGDIVHNSQEVQRLQNIGLQTIDNKQFKELKNVKVLLRAHGEPPETYRIAEQNGIQIIDASCRVVLALQQKIKSAHENFPNAQIVIFGKSGHAEVLGLEGQIDYSAIIVENEDDLEKIDFSRQIFLFSQTTMPLDGFEKIVNIIQLRVEKGVDFRYYDTICRQVSNRISEIKKFAQRFDTVIFVGGNQSSNGKVLYEVCRSVNKNAIFVSAPEDIDLKKVKSSKSIGICGATSTPVWLMENVKKQILTMINF
ncbi:MAG: 4-hydroxy-3-methylbut-2-enyl diphosphate reductase [Prevotellaceae bacterium]|jgi:4-hydroxy-3-methylbut-2-enyl diphosphate reductase|nr:4-hydroxy-3-methylbut-2-enyl diphosphate reductase [Prevotellaceae bacterium]